ncbi:MAG: MBL fold metallo-hydrolase [Acidobacteriota bacterium]
MSDLIDQSFGASRALLGEGNGRYPDANALLVEGPDANFLLDAPLGVVRRLREAPESIPALDAVVVTHCHEDHIPALSELPETRCLVHEEDLPGLQSIDGFLDLFGYPEPRRSEWREFVTETFLFEPRPDAETFIDGTTWELGGDVRIEAIHAPGHTRGHCVFLIEPDEVLFLVDIDLSGFGPYYGDAWSDLESFEATIDRVAQLEARHYLTGHHLGVVDHETFVRRIGRYRQRIAQREERLLAFLSRPRTMAEIVDHRIVYRPHDEGEGIDFIERRSAELHLERLQRDGAVGRHQERFVAL